MREARRSCGIGVRLGAALGAFLALAGGLDAQTAPVIARAAAVTGRAVLSNGTGAPSLALTSGYSLNPGDRIDTRGGGRVVIDLSDGSMLVVQPESIVVLKDFRAASSLRELLEITLGIVRVKINHLGGRPNPYRMNSPTASIAVRGTEFSIEVSPEGDTRVVVYEGAVEVTSLTDPSRSTLVEAGRGVPVQPGQNFQLFTPPAGRDGVAPDIGGRAAVEQPAASEDRDESPRATASTYDRYMSSLSNVNHLPFLFRFNAFAEPHLDSLENPAYAAGFRSGEMRVVLLPSLRGDSAWGSGGTASGASGILPGAYAGSSQFSFFMPVRNSQFAVGGSFTGGRVGTSELTATPDFDPLTLGAGNSSMLHTSGTSTSNLYCASLVLARRAGPNGFGLELQSLRGTGSMNTTTTDTDVPGQASTERIVSSSDVRETRLTAGYTRDISSRATLGVFYRYAFIGANDTDLSHTINGDPSGLNSPRRRATPRNRDAASGEC